MTFESSSFLGEMVEFSASPISFKDRLNNIVHIIARDFKLEEAIYFALDKAKESLVSSISSNAAIPSHKKIEFRLGEGLVGKTAVARRIITRQRNRLEELDKLIDNWNPFFQTLIAFPVSDENFLYGVLLLLDRVGRAFTIDERKNIKIACSILSGILRQALVQEEAKKRIAELSVLFEISKSVTSTIQLNELLERIVSTTAKVVCACGASLNIIDSNSREMLVSAIYGKIPEGFSVLPDILHKQGNSEFPYAHREYTDSEGNVHYCVAVPLGFKDQWNGTLAVYDKPSPESKNIPFSLENRQLLYTIAGIIVNAIKNALTYKNLADISDIGAFISRSIEFSPEHHETGMTILNYFGTVLRQKYPGMKVKVRIEQENLIVRMIVQTEEGNIEKVEKTLEEYGLVITGQLSPEKFFSDPFEVLQLKNQLRIAYVQLENQREISGIQKTLYGQRISSLEEEAKWLRSHVGSIMIDSQKNNKLIENIIIGTFNLLENRDEVIESAISLINKKIQVGITQNDLSEVKQALELIKKRNPGFFHKFVDKINLLILQGSISGLSGNLLTDLLKSFF